MLIYKPPAKSNALVFAVEKQVVKPHATGRKGHARVSSDPVNVTGLDGGAAV
jgi:hypothetical protein